MDQSNFGIVFFMHNQLLVHFWNNIYDAQPIINYNWLELLAMVEFACNNIVHSSTQ
jgi:hypothetical protein